MTRLRPVILSGGSGTRLWPISTPERPKQFGDIAGEPLFGLALNRLAGMPGVGDPVVVAGRDHLDHVEAGLDGRGLVLVEPEGRNTAPAVIAAALALDDDEVMAVLPADHLIPDTGAFHEAVTRAVEMARNGYLVTFGVVPSRPETGYGYIEPGPGLDGGSEVARFKEKPDPDEAARLSTDGKHLWNSGMFVFGVGSLLEEARVHVPDVVNGVEEAFAEAETQGRVKLLGDSFTGVEGISIDHAVMERTSMAAVVPLDAGWSDIGSWHSLWEVSEKDADGNVLVGDAQAVEVSGSYIRSTSRRVAVAGLDNVVVVETPDAVLVVGRESAQLVKRLATDD